MNESEKNKNSKKKIEKKIKEEKLILQHHLKKIKEIYGEIYSDKTDVKNLLKNIINENIYEKLEDKTLDIKERKILYENFFRMIYEIDTFIDNFQSNYLTKQSYIDIFFNLYINNINEDLDEILIKILNIYIQNYFNKENIKDFFQFISQFYYKKKILTPIILNKIINILYIIYGKNDLLIEDKLNYIYFLQKKGIINIEINSNDKNIKKFENGMFIMLRIDTEYFKELKNYECVLFEIEYKKQIVLNMKMNSSLEISIKKEEKLNSPIKRTNKDPLSIYIFIENGDLVYYKNNPYYSNLIKIYIREGFNNKAVEIYNHNYIFSKDININMISLLNKFIGKIYKIFGGFYYFKKEEYENLLNCKNNEEEDNFLINFDKELKLRDMKKNIYIFSFDNHIAKRKEEYLINDKLGNFKCLIKNGKLHTFSNIDEQILLDNGLYQFFPLFDLLYKNSLFLENYHDEIFINKIVDLMVFLLKTDNKFEIILNLNINFWQDFSIFFENFMEIIFNDELFKSFIEIYKILYKKLKNNENKNIEYFFVDYYKYFLFNKNIISKFSINIITKFYNIFEIDDIIKITDFNNLLFIIVLLDKKNNQNITYDEFENNFKLFISLINSYFKNINKEEINIEKNNISLKEYMNISKSFLIDILLLINENEKNENKFSSSLYIYLINILLKINHKIIISVCDIKSIEIKKFFNYLFNFNNYEIKIKSFNLFLYFFVSEILYINNIQFEEEKLIFEEYTKQNIFSYIDKLKNEKNEILKKFIIDLYINCINNFKFSEKKEYRNFYILYFIILLSNKLINYDNNLILNELINIINKEENISKNLKPILNFILNNLASNNNEQNYHFDLSNLKEKDNTLYINLFFYIYKFLPNDSEFFKFIKYMCKNYFNEILLFIKETYIKKEVEKKIVNICKNYLYCDSCLSLINSFINQKIENLIELFIESDTKNNENILKNLQDIISLYIDILKKFIQFSPKEYKQTLNEIKRVISINIINISELIKKDNISNNEHLLKLLIDYSNNLKKIIFSQKLILNEQKMNELIQKWIISEKIVKYKINTNEIIMNHQISKLINEMKLKKNIIKNYKHIIKKSFLFNGYWSNKEIWYGENKRFLKFKYYNYITPIFTKPFLYPIININVYLNSRYNKKKEEVFINDKEVEDIYNYSFTLNSSLINYSNLLNIKELEEKFDDINKSNFKELEIYKCCLVKIDRHIKGYIYFDKDFTKFYFKSCFNLFSEPCNDLYENCLGSPNTFYYLNDKFREISFNLQDISLIFKRNYYYLYTSMEIFLKNGKNYYFNFVKEEICNTVIDFLVSYLSLKIINNDYNKEKKILGYFNENNIIYKHLYKKSKNQSLISNILNKWYKNKISNFNFIMILNILSNRSFNDINQYPILPTILYNDLNSVKYRDLKNELYIINQLYEEVYPNFNNAIISSTILKNIFPFNFINTFVGNKNLNVSLFSRNIDYNKLINESLPENYYSPEMYKNINNLKINEEKNFLNEIEYFLLILNKTLENSETSKDLPNWIDLIFGFYSNKRKDKINNNNELINRRISENENEIECDQLTKNDKDNDLNNLPPYKPESYIDDVNENNINRKDPNLVDNVNNGLMPLRLFNDKILEKKINNFDCDDIIQNLSKFKKSNENMNIPKSFLLLKINEKNTILIRKNLIVIKSNNFSIFSKQVSALKYNFYPIKKFFKIIKTQSQKLYKIKNNHIVISKKNDYIFIGGQVFNNLTFINLEFNFYKNISFNYYKTFHNKTFECLCLVEIYKSFLLCGDDIGTIFIFEINNNYRFDPSSKNNNENEILKEIKIIHAHINSITHLVYNSDLNIIASSSLDCYVNLYNFNNFEIINSFKEDNKITYVFIISNQLPSIIIYIDKKKIKSYTINGCFIEEIEEINLTLPIIYQNKYFSSYLVYLHSPKKLKVLNVPFFSESSKVYIEFEHEISCYDINNKNNTIIGCSMDGIIQEIKK